MINSGMASPGDDYVGAAEFFDAEWYRTTNPDIGDLDPWTHFTHFGEKERRSPGPTFDSTFYASTYLRLEQGDALKHFLREGHLAGLLPAPAVHTRETSREAMSAALAEVERPFILIGNDAQQAGAPLLLLELARHLTARGYTPVTLLLKAGPLMQAFRDIGPTLVMAEGYCAGGLAQALEPGVPVLGNTAVSAATLAQFGSNGPRALLVHEMPRFVAEHDLAPSVAQAPLIIASFPGMISELEALLSPTPPIVSIVPGLLHVSVGPASTERVAGLLRAGLGDRAPLFLGAGYADKRKGFDRFLTIATEIYARNAQSGFIWLGELSAWAQELAHDAIAGGLPLLLPGFRSDAAAWYDNVDVYLLVSRQDPGPSTVIDAARRGTPFVAAPGDLGLHSLSELLSGVGTFCTSDTHTVDEALLTAEREQPRDRARRAAFIEERASFARYVDEILEVMLIAGD